jgi:alpha-1,2-mannosyltransferase
VIPVRPRDYDDPAVHAERNGGVRDVRRLIALAVPAIAFGLVIAILAVYFQRGFVPGDAFVYLAAGERLNAGHLLYALSPGDRPMAMEPPYWTVPLLSPPPIAVLFRPLASLPNDVGAYIWWALDIAAVSIALLLMVVRRPVLIGIALTVFSVPLVYELGVGNMNGLILLGLVLTWRATAIGDERSAGVLTGLMAAFKLTPAILGWWLLTAGRWRAVGAAIATGLVVLAVSVVGAGLDAHLRFLGIVRDTAAVGARPLSLAGMALYVGVPASIANVLPTAALVVGTVATAVLRRRRDLAFIAAVMTIVFGSPTVSINWFIYLFACLAHFVWPLRDASLAPSTSPEAVDGGVRQPAV